MNTSGLIRHVVIGGDLLEDEISCILVIWKTDTVRWNTRYVRKYLTNYIFSKSKSLNLLLLIKGFHSLQRRQPARRLTRFIRPSGIVVKKLSQRFIWHNLLPLFNTFAYSEKAS